MSHAIRFAHAALAAVVTASLVEPASAQSRQRFGVQGSGVAVRANASGDLLDRGKPGWEAQGRLTLGRFSLGAGYQRSEIFRFRGADASTTLETLFVEPRVVVFAVPRLGVYAAGRVGAGQHTACGTSCVAISTRSLVAGGGGGLLLRVAGPISADVGVQQYLFAEKPRQSFTMARVGVSVGLF